MGRPHTCPYCGAVGKSVSKGVRKTKTMGDRRIRFCKACKRKLTPKNQKTLEPQRQEAEGSVEPQPRLESGEAPTDTGAPKEPAQAFAEMLLPPDQEWTS
jgi:predicted  nucleic acid-binding Zn-ribbon protein